MSFLSGLFSDKKTVEQNQQSNQTSSSNTGLSNQVKDYWSSIGGMYNPASWSNVDPNAYQTDAANRTAGYASGLNPAFATANQIGGTGISTGDIGRFMSPYTQSVVDATRANFDVTNARSDAQTNANAAKLGALSGTQPLVARAITDSMRRPGQDATIAGLYDKGYQTALGAAGQSTGLQLQGLSGASQIAGQQSGINQTGFGQGTQLWNQDWQNSGMPYDVAGKGAQVLTALSPQSGVTSTGSSTGSSTSTTTATPSPFSIGANIAGMAISAYTGMPMPSGGGKKDGGRVEMATGGSVGIKPRESDPHHRLTSTFEAVRGMFERARGGSVLPKFEAGGSVGPSYSPGWNTTVTPASWTDNVDMKKLGDGLTAMGKPKDASGGQDDGAGALRAQQQDLSSFMSQHSIKPGYADGGEVEDYGGADGDLPAPVAGSGGGGSGLPPGPTRDRMKGYVPETAQNFTNAVKRFEGYAPKSSWDYKQNSVGYGTRARYPGEVIDRPEADRRLNTELENARGQVTAFAPNVDPGTAAALTSLTYNAGTKWMTSGLGAAIRAGDMDTARRLFREYNKAGGEVQPGLVKRRAEESSWMGRDDVPASTGSVAMGGGDAGSTGLAPAAPPAEKSWLQRNLPGLTEGVFNGQKMTPGQRLGTALMAVESPTMKGPTNGIARAIMEMDGSRQKDDQIKNQVDQFGRTMGLKDRELALSEAKTPAEIALLQAQAAAQRAAQENGQYVPYDPTKGVLNARTGETTKPLQDGSDTQKIFNEKYAEKAPELLEKSGAAYGDANGMVSSVRELSAIAPYAETGFGQEQVLALRKMGARFGLDVSDKVAPTELFRALSQNFVLQAAQKLKPLSNSDVTFVQKGLATIESDPSTLKTLLPGMQAIAERQAMVEQKRMEYLSRGKPPPMDQILREVDAKIPSPIIEQYGVRPTPTTQSAAPSARSSQESAGQAEATRQKLLAMPDGAMVLYNGKPKIKQGDKLIDAPADRYSKGYFSGYMDNDYKSIPSFP